MTLTAQHGSFPECTDPVAAIDPQYYQLVDAHGTTTTTDDTVQLPATVTYDSGTNTAVLDFISIPVAAAYELRIGAPEASTDAPVQLTTVNDDDSVPGRSDTLANFRRRAW